MNAQRVVDPQLERCRHREVVHRRVDNERIRRFDFTDQLLGDVELRLIRRARRDGARIVAGDAAAAARLPDRVRSL